MASIISNTCLLSSSSSSPATFTFKTHHHQPINLHVTTSFKPISLHKKNHNLPNLITFVTSKDNNNNNNNNTLVLEADEQHLTWENESMAIDNGVSEWDGIPVAGETDEYSEEDVKVFVGNLPYDVDSEQLAQLFQQAGVVEVSEVIYNRETDQSRGFGFVTMSTVEEADKAVEMLHRYELGGRYLTVNKAALKGSRPERTTKISGPSYRAYVGNLPWDADDVRLEQIFSEYGKVVNARVVYDRESGRSRGFGFVTMSSESELHDAIENLDGQSFGGRVIRVNVAEENPRRF